MNDDKIESALDEVHALTERLTAIENMSLEESLEFFHRLRDEVEEEIDQLSKDDKTAKSAVGDA